jgi:glycosyltransferase involved in cell wall biosynthesis
VINEPIAEENKNEIRSKYNLPSGKIFVTASSFIPRKNIEQLINIFKEREETLLIIGDGPLKEKYIQLIQENNSKNIIMMSYMKKKNGFLRRMKIMNENEVRILAHCAECGAQITDDIKTIFVDSDGNYFDGIDCLTEYFGVTQIER